VGKPEVQILDGGGDATLLVPRGNDNREPLERSEGLEFKRSGAFLRSCFPNREAGGAGQVGLVFVEGEEFVRAGLASDGDMEEVHRTDGQVAGMDSAKFVGGADGVGPTKLNMGPIAEADFLFQCADHGTGVRQKSQPFGLADGVENFHAMPRTPKHVYILGIIPERDGFGMVQVASVFKCDPPRCVGVDGHFFKERRKATESKLGGVPQSEQSDSASSRVILGRLPTWETTNLGLPLAVTTS